MIPIREACEVPLWATACEPPPVARRIIRAIARWWPLWLAAVLTLGVCVGPRVVICRAPKIDITKLTTQMYARRAYPAWRLDHPDRTCPATLAELDDYADEKHLRDEWGREYAFTCADGALVVRSLGQDGVAGTHDDITSEDR